jgi:hypothetical protein
VARSAAAHTRLYTRVCRRISFGNSCKKETGKSPRDPRCVHYICSRRGPAGVRGLFVRCFFYNVGRPLMPPCRGAAAGGATLPHKNKRKSTPGPRPDPGVSRCMFLFKDFSI